MVDAYAAVKSSLVNTETDNLNVDLQAYITNHVSGIDFTTFSGISWARTGTVDKVEYSLDGKSWKEAQYGSSTNASIYINWIISLDSEELSFAGDHVLLVRSVGVDGTNSISDHSEFYAYGESSEIASDRMLAIIFVIGALLLTAIAVTAYRKKLFYSQ